MADPRTPRPPPGSPFPDARDSRTAAFRRLETAPQTAIDLLQLSPEEREQVRVIDIDVTSCRSLGRSTPAFIPVFYLSDDETAAIDLFATLNSNRLTSLDVERPNALERSLTTDMYTKILASAGRLRVTRYEWVVREVREDNTWWLVHPECYDDRPDARYQPGRFVTRVPPDVSLLTLYHRAGDIITTTDIDTTPVEGNPGNVLRYYLAAETYRCRVDVSAENTPVLRKEDPATNEK